MKTNQNNVFLSIIIFTLIFIIASCELPTNQEEENLGVVKIELNDQINARSTLVPALNMDVDDYVITGVGPEGRSFTPIILSSGSSTIEGLYKGTWTITVTARNAEGDDIGIGTANVVVEPQKTNTVQISVVPIHGEGTLTISGSWTEGDIANPQILATLEKDGEDTPIVLEFTIEGNTASFTDDTLSSGYYILRIGLYDGDTDDINNRLMGKVLAVRIVAGHVTTGTMEITSGDLNVVGNLKVTIQNDIRNPYEVFLSKSASSIFLERNLTLTASVLPEGNYFFNWFLDGDIISGETGNSITIGENLHLGTHFVDVMVSGEGVLSSASTSFSIQELNNGYMYFKFTPNDDSEVLEYTLTAGLEGAARLWKEENFITFQGVPVGLVNLVDGQLNQVILLSSDTPFPEDFLNGSYNPEESIIMGMLQYSEEYPGGGITIQNAEDNSAKMINGELNFTFDDYGAEGNMMSCLFSGSEMKAYEGIYNEENDTYDSKLIEDLTYSLEGEFNVLRFLDFDSYYLTYDANGADEGEVPNRELFIEGQVAWINGNYYGLEKDGYVFSGWNTKADGTGITYNPNDTLTMGLGPVTLYALWIGTYDIGDTGPAGGIIFYAKDSASDGWQYLEAATSDIAIGNDYAHIFGYYRTTPTGAAVLVNATATEIGAGKANTTSLVDAMGSAAYVSNDTSTTTTTENYAARLCDTLVVGAYEDWFLPSKGELDLMYDNLKMNGLGGFSAQYYWNSSELYDTNACYQDFNIGTQYASYKYAEYRVRAVRAF